MNIFEPFKIKNLELKNRIVRSATWEGMCAPDGAPLEKVFNVYRQLSLGGVGLIITGYCFVNKDAKQLPGQMGLASDETIDLHKELVEEAHYDDAPIIAQLVHCGGQAANKFYDDSRIIAPSAVELPFYPKPVEEASIEDIKQIVQDFADSALRAKKCGYDGVQLHAAHGYLISQFLSPYTNKRTDQYGGELKNRIRFLKEVYDAVREAVGDDYIVMIKLNGSDKVEGGLTERDAVITAKLLDKIGIDAIEVSGGLPVSPENSPVVRDIKMEHEEGYNLDYAVNIKSHVDCPVISVGGFRTRGIVENALELVDMVAMSRPFIYEPDLVNAWKDNLSVHSRCVSCNGCFKPGVKEGGIRCILRGKKGM